MAIRSLLQWSKSYGLVASIAILLFMFSFVDSTLEAVPSVYQSDMVKLKLSTKAKETGAFCLDGSLPGYHFHKGSGSGSKSWLLFLEGGSWCSTIESCSSRAMTSLGSSKYIENVVAFRGVLSSDPPQNPDFFNWNRVMIRYCDGGSFAGHPEAKFKGLFFRGQLIWEAIMDDLLSMGMAHAKQAILTGSSAGGLAALLNCDQFRDHLPIDASVKCVSEGGFFSQRVCYLLFITELRVCHRFNEANDYKPDVLGNPTMRSSFHNIVSLQGIVKSLDKKCVAKTEPSNVVQCMFPQEFLHNIKTPVFLVNPAYDYWQIQNVLVPASADPDGKWAKCRLNIQECDATQIIVLHGFRSSLIDEIGNFIRTKTVTIAESIGDWYFNRKPVKLIDCPYPCNTSC